jgi:hypothetical protein
VAEALRLTSEQLRERDQATFGEYAASAAELVERFSGHLKERDINQMIWEIESFGRRQPALFMGGAFALGFLASRFLKSSSERYDGYYTRRAGGNGYGATTGHALPTAYDRGNERAASTVSSTGMSASTTSSATIPRSEPTFAVETTSPATAPPETAGTDDLAGTRRE